jgi:hypothetical protein
MVQLGKRLRAMKAQAGVGMPTSQLIVMDKSSGLISSANELTLQRTLDTALLVVNTDTADYPIRVMSADGTTTIMRLDNSGNLLLGGATQNIGSQASYSLSVPTGIGVSGTTWGYLGIPDYLTLSGAGTWLVTGSVHYNIVGSPTMSQLWAVIMPGTAANPLISPAVTSDSNKFISKAPLAAGAASTANASFPVSRVITNTSNISSLRVFIAVQAVWTGGTAPTVNFSTDTYLTAVKIA